jgi:chemotaxis signal transduction protein
MNESDDLAREILKVRARALARPPVLEQERQVRFDLVTFKVMQCDLAIESKFVDEVFWISNLTPVPQTGALVRGLTSLHGQVFTVIDMAVLLGLKAEAAEPGACEERREIGLLIRFGALRLALSIDELIGVREIDDGELSPAILADALSASEDSRLKNFYQAASDVLIILDAKRIFTDSMIVALAG